MRYIGMIFFVIIIAGFTNVSCVSPEKQLPKWDLSTMKRIELKFEEPGILEVTDFEYLDSAKGPRIFLTDFIFGISCVSVNLEGELVSVFGAPGQGPGEYRYPGGLTVTHDRLFLASGNQKLNTYDLDGNWRSNFDIPAITGFTQMVANPIDGTFYCGSFSRYSKNSVFHVDRDGRVLQEFSPPDTEFGFVFDTLWPTGGLLFRDGFLYQFFNHKYEVIQWTSDGTLVARHPLATNNYVKPKYRMARKIQGGDEEKKFRNTFTMFIGLYSLEKYYVTHLRNWVDSDTYKDVLEVFDINFQIKSYLELDDHKLVGTDGKTILFFYENSSDQESALLFMSLKEK